MSDACCPECGGPMHWTDNFCSDKCAKAWREAEERWEAEYEADAAGQTDA